MKDKEQAIYTELGSRIRKYREDANLSQDNLAGKLGISRSTLSQIESGERRISADEIIRLSKIFDIQTDVLFGLKKEPEVLLHKQKAEKEAKKELRINVPQKNIAKFKEVLLYILGKIGSRPNIGETVIYKLLYFIDFDYYEKYEEQMIGATYIKNHYGPTPVEFKKIISDMEKNNEIEKATSKYFSYPQTKYLPHREPNLRVLNATELRLIDDVINRFSNMNATELSEYSHGDIPWLSAEDGEKIEYESVFYRTPPYSVREYR